MPLIGYFLGAQFEHFITHIDHWIAFGLLSVIGVNMIRESISQQDNETTSRDVTHYTDENKHDVIGASEQVTESKSASMLICVMKCSN